MLNVVVTLVVLIVVDGVAVVVVLSYSIVVGGVVIVSGAESGETVVSVSSLSVVAGAHSAS